MIRRLYYKGEKQTRYLTIHEIATACRISPKKVKGWVAQKFLHSTAVGEELVAEDDILTFLLQNKMPVVASLLPSNAVKILCIACSRVELREKEECFDHICTLFAENHNLVLAESTTLGRPCYLSILTFAPDVVIIFQKSFNKDLVETLEFLSTMPALQSILIVDEATKLAVDNGLLAIPADLIVSENLSDDELTARLSEFFTS
jgi:hypothetical protein